jgi:hypothetical protein
MRYDLIVILAVAGLFPAIWIVTKLVQWWDRLARIESGIERRESGVERSRSRIQFLSIRTNVLALVLISLVAFLTVSLDAYRTIWPDRSLSSGALEKLLQSKLPDSEVQAQRHREIVEALRDRRPSGTVPGSVNDEAVRTELLKFKTSIDNLEEAAKERISNVEVLRYAAWTVLVSLFLAGIFFFSRSFYETRPEKKALERAVAVALTVPTLFGGLKLATDLKFDITLIKDLGGVHFPASGLGSQPLTPTEPRDIDIHLHLDVLRGQDSFPAAMDCGEDGKQTVGPFDVGDKTLTKPKRTTEGVIRELQTRVAGKPERLTAIILIGSADKRSLKPRTAELYSSNAGLARARIGVVRDALKETFKKSTPPILEFYAGPAMTDAKLSADDLSPDRAVQVCVLWDRKPDPAQEASGQQ